MKTVRPRNVLAAFAITAALVGVPSTANAATLVSFTLQTPAPPAGGFQGGTAIHSVTNVLGECDRHKFFANNVLQAQTPHTCKTTNNSTGSWSFNVFSGTIIKGCWATACGSKTA